MKQLFFSTLFLFFYATVLTAQHSTTILEEDIKADTKDMNPIIEANNRFAFDLYSKYKTEDGNIFMSPYSIFTALSMTYEGAKGQTAKEMEETLHLPENTKLRRESFRQIHNEINKDDKEYKLSTANALWAQQSYQFNKNYFNLIETYYEGKATSLDFIGDTEGSRLTINKWVEEKTNDKIKDLIPSGALTSAIKLVLTNAIYFKGEWVKQFNKEYTKEQNFRITPNNTVQIPMMQRTDDKSIFNYSEASNFQMLELPYSGNDLSMLIILPKDNLESIENSLTLENLLKWKEGLSKQKVNVYIPKLKFETKYFMQKPLSEMGLPTAFSDLANFTGMVDTPKANLKISKVIHQAFIELNEEGTEAAAATAVIMTRTATAYSPPKPTFRADHPFIFIIQQKNTGNILFIGRVYDPS